MHLSWDACLCITNDSFAVRSNHVKCSSKRKVLKHQAMRYEKLLQINHPSIYFPPNVILNFSAGFSGREIKLQADFEHSDIIFFLFADRDFFLWQPQGV